MTIYTNRYQARKHAKYGDMIVKVKGGYILMDTREYYTREESEAKKRG